MPDPKTRLLEGGRTMGTAVLNRIYGPVDRMEALRRGEHYTNFNFYMPGQAFLNGWVGVVNARVAVDRYHARLDREIRLYETDITEIREIYTEMRRATTELEKGLANGRTNSLSNYAQQIELMKAREAALRTYILEKYGESL